MHCHPQHPNRRPQGRVGQGTHTHTHTHTHATTHLEKDLAVGAVEVLGGWLGEVVPALVVLLVGQVGNRDHKEADRVRGANLEITTTRGKKSQARGGVGRVN